MLFMSMDWRRCRCVYAGEHLRASPEWFSAFSPCLMCFFLRFVVVKRTCEAVIYFSAHSSPKTGPPAIVTVLHVIVWVFVPAVFVLSSFRSPFTMTAHSASSVVDAAAAGAPANRRGRGGGHRGRGRFNVRRDGPMKFEKDFDFESANAQFNKEEIDREFQSKLKLKGSSVTTGGG